MSHLLSAHLSVRLASVGVSVHVSVCRLRSGYRYAHADTSLTFLTSTAPTMHARKWLKIFEPARAEEKQHWKKSPHQAKNKTTIRFEEKKKKQNPADGSWRCHIALSVIFTGPLPRPQATSPRRVAHGTTPHDSTSLKTAHTGGAWARAVRARTTWRDAAAPAARPACCRHRRCLHSRQKQKQSQDQTRPQACARSG